MTQTILRGFAANPNIFGTVVIGLGCENVGHRELREAIEKITNKPIVSFGIQEEGGTPDVYKRQPYDRVELSPAQ